MIEKVFQGRREFLVELLQGRELVNVQVQEVAERVVICFELEHCEALIESLQHFLRIHA